jgi:hypothetical protein
MVRIRKYHYALETLVTSHLSQIIRIVASGVTSNITPLHGRRTSDHQFVRVPLGEAPTSPLVDSPWVQSRDLTAVTSPVTVNKVVLFCNPNQPSNCISVNSRRPRPRSHKSSPDAVPLGTVGVSSHRRHCAPIIVEWSLCFGHKRRLDCKHTVLIERFV